jgi:hypothetical protein
MNRAERNLMRDGAFCIASLKFCALISGFHSVGIGAARSRSP